MRIVEIELYNHLVLPEKVHIDLRNDSSSIICINGYNGSGKTFLMSTLHPLARSKRGSTRYPIVRGKNGYKRLLIHMHGDTYYEVFHEYTANGDKSHSAKSYLTLIEGEHREELNKEGLVQTFEKLIKERLYFSSGSSVCSYLSPNIPNIVNSTQSDRRAILESTMGVSDTLGLYQDNLNLLYKTNNDLYKRYNGQMAEVLRDNNCHSLTDMEHKIETLNSDIVESKNMLGREKLILEEMSAIDTNDYSSIKETIESYISLLGRYDFINIKQMIEKLEEVEIERVKLDTAFTIKEEAYNEAKSNIDLSNKIEFINKELENLANIKLSSLEVLDKVNYNIELNSCDILVKLNKLSDMIHNIANRRITHISDVTVTFDPKIILNSLNDEKSRHEDIMRQYEDISKNIIGEEVKTEKLSDKCDNCNLYVKAVLNKRYLEDNEETYTISKERMETIEGEIEDYLLISEFKEFYDADLKNICKYDLAYSIKDIIHANGANILEPIRDSISNINHAYNAYKKAESDTNELLQTKASINTKGVTSKGIQSLQDELSSIKEKLEAFNKYDGIKLKDIIRDSKYEELGTIRLLELRDRLNKKLEDIKNKKSRLLESKKNIEELERKIEVQVASASKLTAQKDSILKLSNEILNLSNDTKYYKDLKPIITKSLPIKLLTSTFGFIESMVNRLLSINDLPLQIEIVLDNDNIRIPVYTKDNEVEDATFVSSGEMCILAMCINSIIVNMTGYNIICFDELDANLDIVYREKFYNLLTSVLEEIGIEQVFCISHNTSFDIPASHIVIGDYKEDRLQGNIIAKL